MNDTADSPKLADAVLDPVPAGLTPEGVTKLCDDALAEATRLLDEIRGLDAAKGDSAIGFEAVLGKLDAIHFALGTGGGFPHLMAEAHPDVSVRAAARACEPRFDEFETNLMLDAKLADAVERVAKKGEPLDGPSARLLEHTQRDLRRNGLMLPKEKQARLRALNDALSRKGQEFSKNIAEASDFIDIAPSSLEGLPKEYVAAKLAVMLPDGKVRITTSYPDYFPFLRYAEDREAALRLYAKFESRAAKNLGILDDLLRLREEKAHLLGYASWADYVIEPRMAKDAKTVRAFLEKVRDAVKEPAAAELRLFQEKQKALGRPVEPLYGCERLYLEEKLREERFGFDSKELSQYFEVGRTKRGLLEISAELYGLEIREVSLTRWHPEVEVYEVRDGSRTLGRLYLDLFPRENKFQHAAVFGIRPSKRLSDGSRVLPIAALVCNFPRASAGQPALLTHDEVVTFFHELGHVLHQLLTEAPYSAFSGTATARDFVETPSQMFEEWAYRRKVLDRFARHHETGALIPDDLFQALLRSRGFGRAIATQRQLFFSALDLEYHTRPSGFDTTAVLKEIHAQYQPFTFLEGTHFQASFGHLVGYDAGYYGYQWALSLSRDVLTRFEEEGMMNRRTADSYRQSILAPGGSEDETAMVTHFLGRAPNESAYIAFLRAGLSTG